MENKEITPTENKILVSIKNKKKDKKPINENIAERAYIHHKYLVENDFEKITATTVNNELYFSIHSLPKYLLTDKGKFGSKDYKVDISFSPNKTTMMIKWDNVMKIMNDIKIFSLNETKTGLVEELKKKGLTESDAINHVNDFHKKRFNAIQNILNLAKNNNKLPSGLLELNQSKKSISEKRQPIDIDSNSIDPSPLKKKKNEENNNEKTSLETPALIINPTVQKSSEFNFLPRPSLKPITQIPHRFDLLLNNEKNNPSLLLKNGNTKNETQTDSELYDDTIKNTIIDSFPKKSSNESILQKLLNQKSEKESTVLLQPNQSLNLQLHSDDIHTYNIDLNEDVSNSDSDNFYSDNSKHSIPESSNNLKSPKLTEPSIWPILPIGSPESSNDLNLIQLDDLPIIYQKNPKKSKRTYDFIRDLMKQIYPSINQIRMKPAAKFINSLLSIVDEIDNK